MKALRRALRRAARRIRLMHALQWSAWGLLAGGIAAFVVTAMAFFLPFAPHPALILPLITAFLGGFTGLLWPPSALAAAKLADAHGLMERAQTALHLQGNDAFTLLQREDTIAALDAFDCRCIPLPRPKRPLLIALALTGLSIALLQLPNPQSAVIAQQEAFDKAAEAAANQADREAEALPEDGQESAELRRLLTDLSRDLRQAQTDMEAMLALSDAQERLENLRSQTAADALEQMKHAASAQVLEEMLQAMQSGSADAMAQAIQNAQSSGTASADFQQLAASALQTAADFSRASQLLSALRSAMGMAGSGQTSTLGLTPGGNGEGVGSGAGKGSTNLKEGETGEEKPGLHGSDDPRYKEEKHERIYDPTRLDAAQTELTADNPRSDGPSSQLQLGPGAGMVSESVPYSQVVQEYASAASQAAETRNLSSQERQWVEDYFAALTESTR